MPWPDEDDRALEYTDVGGGVISAPVTGYTAWPVNFDGTTTFLNRGAALTGAPVNSEDGSLSFWFRMQGGDGANQILVEDNGTSTTLQILRQTTNLMRIQVGSGGSVFNWTSVTTFTAGGGWNHILCSWKGETTTGTALVNGTSEGSPVVTGATNPQWSVPTDWDIGARTAGSLFFNGDMADLWISADTFIDFSIGSNVAKFRSGGHPVDLGSTGQIPLSASPIMFFGGTSFTSGSSANNWANNQGTGGGFSVAAGALTHSALPNP